MSYYVDFIIHIEPPSLSLMYSWLCISFFRFCGVPCPVCLWPEVVLNISEPRYDMKRKNDSYMDNVIFDTVKPLISNPLMSDPPLIADKFCHECIMFSCPCYSTSNNRPPLLSGHFISFYFLSGFLSSFYSNEFYFMYTSIFDPQDEAPCRRSRCTRSPHTRAARAHLTRPRAARAHLTRALTRAARSIPTRCARSRARALRARPPRAARTHALRALTRGQRCRVQSA